MKRGIGCTGLLAALLALTATAQAQTCLIISEVVDGDLSGGNPKFVEITNTGTSAVLFGANDFLRCYFNGAVTATTNVSLNGLTVAAGDSVVIASSSSGGQAAFENTYGFPADLYTTAFFGNGDDTYSLENGTTVIDLYGVIGVDGSGQVWEYTDGYARRNASANQANATFTPAEWTFGGVASLDGPDDPTRTALLLANTNPGTHSFNTGCGGPAATGACCYGNGLCTVTTATDCVATFNGVYQGNNSQCTGQCPGTPGACCLVGGACQDVASEGACIALGGAYQGLNTTCATTVCPGVTGRCCTNGVCTTVSQNDCLNGGGVYYGDGTTCENFTCPILGQPQCFIISEVVDGDLPGGNPKYVEITNTGATAITFTAADSLKIYTNGSLTATASVSLDTISIAAGDSFVIASDANGGIAQFVAAYGFNADLYTPVFFGNGDDVYTLESNATIIDVYGVIGVDGTGQPWEYTDSYARRNAAANQSNSTFNPAEWTFGGVAALDGPDDPTRIALLQANTNPGVHAFDPGCGGLITGACCYGNGFCVVTTAAECTTTFNGTYQGNNTTCDQVTCPGTPGACCLLDGTCQDVASEAACAAANGVYQGLNTSCATTNCPPPVGACCTQGVCTDATEADCIAGGGIWRGIGTSCATSTCPPGVQAVAKLDIAFGLNTASALTTAEQVRGCAHLGNWTDLPANNAFLQSMEFDNFGGPFSHSANGNLLSLNFGPPPAGPGLLYNLSTDGSDNAELIFTFDVASGLSTSARVVGLGVSNDNQKVSIIGNNTGALYILNYNAGPTVGTGAGASASLLEETVGFAPNGSWGTTWFDDDTVIAATGDPLFTPNTVVVQSKTIGSAATSVRTGISVVGNPNTVDIEYNPNYSPYVYVMIGVFTGGVTTNTLVVLDPNTPDTDPLHLGEWSIVGTFDYSTSMQTTREIALGNDDRLYVCQFSSIIDYVDVNALASNVSTDCYTSSVFSSFSGIDVAGPVAEGCPGERGDTNCDGSVDFFDIDPFLLALFNPAGYQATYCGGSLCAADIDCSGAVDFFDIDPFLACLFGPTGCPPCAP